MSVIEIIAVTPRTATVLLSPDQALYHLAEPIAWSLARAGNEPVHTGEATTVSVFLDALEPDTNYEFRAAMGVATFQTPPCAGLIDLTDFGAATGSVDNAPAFAAAIDALPIGGTLYVPAGRYVAKPIFLRSDMTLYLAKGAEIAAPGDRTDWPILPAWDENGVNVGTWEGLPEASFASPITAIGCENLTITGLGRIDGGGDSGDWWSWPKETRDGARRPRTLFLAHCQNVTLSGITVANSPSWTVHPFHCSNLTAAAMFIQNPPDSPNTDGFNPESCVDTQVVGLRISVGDDCIAVKAGKRQKGDNRHLAPTTRLTIRNCLMERGHGAVVLGSEMSGDITDVTITRCTFDGTDRGVRIKTRRGRGGKVARIALDMVHMENVATPLAVNAFYFCDPDGRSDAVQTRDPAPVDETTPLVTDITLRNVMAKGVQHAAAALIGLPEAPIIGISVDGFWVSYDPNATPGVPVMASNVGPELHAGIITEFARLGGDLTVLSPEEI
ncbi:polygalacturonase [Yoonia maritima]|uniref:Polygalacturonase n=1 Tax=Yoonia maritima TaxID=1435347 RepID=A0A2T0VZA1_9RHOB|nr:glycoside hydrolase family 28 protein [Yoonia maritima]PRY77697.1 polygalacturonase [Yoonia maritima]